IYYISGLPQYTEHRSAIILVNKKTAKYLFFFYQGSAELWLKACRRSFLSGLGGCRSPNLCLESADWPCSDHMHSPKKTKNTSLAIPTKLSMVQSDSTQYVLSGDKWGTLEKGRIREVRIKTAFLHTAED
ncbi:unnamed protein product, partial [Staurois parvus]